MKRSGPKDYSHTCTRTLSVMGKLPRNCTCKMAATWGGNTWQLSPLLRHAKKRSACLAALVLISSWDPWEGHDQQILLTRTTRTILEPVPPFLDWQLFPNTEVQRLQGWIRQKSGVFTQYQVCNLIDATLRLQPQVGNLGDTQPLVATSNFKL
jgi:hypothetical protein